MNKPIIPLKLRLSLRQGTVYYFQHREMTSALPHFFIVINPNPCASKTIILNVISSQIDKVKLRRSTFPSNTLIEIFPNEYGELSKHSIIDCNTYKEISLNELINKLDTNQIQYRKDLPKNIIDNIIVGMLASPLIEQEIKDLLS